MKVIVVGKGGREHALIRALEESPCKPELYAFPGSDAIFSHAKPAPGVKDLSSLIDFLVSEKFDLCFAGEESYLVQGLADQCQANGVPCWGPIQASAQLEGSKAFAKEFMKRHGIPTGDYQQVDTRSDAEKAITSYPCVLKYDGLAAGKGVAVCTSEEQASAFLTEVFEDQKFGASPLLIEEYLEGPEISIFCALSDGDYQILTPARDYKRLGDGDVGPNTGGMGAVASREILDASTLGTIEDQIVRPTVEGLQADGLGYRGFLYFGLMLTEEGPKVIEYNCRFGDPECQAVMPLLKGDLASYAYHGAQGTLEKELIQFQNDWSICLVFASAGYPASSHSGDVITGLETSKIARVYHAGTKKNAEDQFETNGGRVLAVVAQGPSREEAVERVYAEAAGIQFDGMQKRSDIGTFNF